MKIAGRGHCIEPQGCHSNFVCLFPVMKIAGTGHCIEPQGCHSNFVCLFPVMKIAGMGHCKEPQICLFWFFFRNSLFVSLILFFMFDSVSHYLKMIREAWGEKFP